MPGLLSDALAWVVIATFVSGALLSHRDERMARSVTAAAWGLFAVFWLQLIPHFAFEHKSYIEGFLSLAAVPACLYAGYLLYSGRDTLFVLSKAVAAMGVIYLPFETIPALALFGVTIPAPRGVLMETVAAQTAFLVNALGYSPEMIVGDQGYLNTFLFMDGSHRLTVSVVLACTGLGSMAIFGGLIAAVDAPLRRKARALAIAIPIIYALNLLRTTFITIAFGKQYMQFFVDEILLMFGSSDPYMVSFFISDRIISQFLAVVALVGVTYLVVREIPELLTVIEDVLYMVTGDEYDLRDALELDGRQNRGGSV
ncbi:archaeosortase A [Halogeometricum limi]|uniref:Archaeosortase A, PGF-CTERM-specific n=1 Tax=Halogeometricum limi TaxID=555875 RepID=A0A1I6GXC4_9EURY|nr:archaeosortase A [Halogeometricum limi]SFR46852.1 archaeosortase A, PGF-CTERM-specific [Halogeometricum limi]